MVKMGLENPNSENLITFVSNHIDQTTGNPFFPTPMPSAADLLAAYTAFETDFTAWVALKTQVDSAAATRDQSRATLIQLMNVRAAYVQGASNGNRQVIVSSGLELRNPRTPVGQLPPPVNFTVELNGVTNLMKFKWDPVYKARGYLIEVSEDVQPRAFGQLANTTKANYQKVMEGGKTYVFRLAASGGSTGQSYWTAEVIRGAA